MNEQQPQNSQRVTVARVLRPQGRRGEVACEILTDFPERLKGLKFAELRKERGLPQQAGQARRVAVRSCWLSPPRRGAGQSRGRQAILHFEGSDSISDAEKLVGLDVQIPLAERVALPSGSYYITDLEDCEVREAATGATVGRVSGVQMTGEGVAGTPILVVDSPRGEVLIPLAQDICVRIDIAARAIDVALPEGLRELNADS